MKKMIWTARSVALISLLSLFAFLSCKKDSAESSDFDPEMDFKLRLLNEKGEVATSFKVGEKFLLSFLIINKINSTRFFTSDRLVNNKDFFRVITSDSSANFGKPYESIICTGLRTTIEAKHTLELRLPWQSTTTVRNSDFCLQNVNKAPLSKGIYKTTLQEFLQVGTLESNRLTKKTDLSVIFEVK